MSRWSSVQNLCRLETRLYLPKLAEEGPSLGSVGVYVSIPWPSAMLKFNSYLLDLEVQVKGYEIKAEESSVTLSCVTATSEILDAKNVIPESSAPLQHTTGLNSGKDDINKNPLIERAAHLVLSPGGGERPFAKRLYAAQYAYLGTIFSFIDVDSFEVNLRKIYDGNVDVSDKDDCLVYCGILLTLAFG
ncbi:hypothetical protein VE02_08371 [Pseudogymnoascus sp. 03VT05]|nr:hypothetical protein VE02_08371 [Pseudogymnoascus sp. 03VT05]